MDTKNMVVLVGRLTADPELRFTNGGDPVANFSIAVNRAVRKSDGSFEDVRDGFFDCEHFGATAEKFAEDIHKGDLVQIMGSLHQDKFKVGDGAGSRTVSKIKVRAKTVARVLVAPRKAATPEVAPAEANSQPVPQPV